MIAERTFLAIGMVDESLLAENAAFITGGCGRSTASIVIHRGLYGLVWRAVRSTRVRGDPTRGRWSGFEPHRADHTATFRGQDVVPGRAASSSPGVAPQRRCHRRNSGPVKNNGRSATTERNCPPSCFRVCRGVRWDAAVVCADPSTSGRRCCTWTTLLSLAVRMGRGGGAARTGPCRRTRGPVYLRTGSGRRPVAVTPARRGPLR